MAERAIIAERSAAQHGARIVSIALTDFRSYRTAAMSLDRRPVALIGRNGAGKTNVLEALSLLGPGRGLRGAPPEDLPRAGGSGGWAAAVRLAVAGAETQLGVGVFADAPTRRVVRIDGASAGGPGALSQHVRFVWLTPAQDRLFVDGPGERRRFLDRMAAVRDVAFAQAHGAFELAMRQRQKLLDDGARDEAWLGALERRMAESAVVIAAARRETASAIAAADVASDWGFPSADLILEGGLEVALEREPAATVEDLYADRLKERRAVDAAAGRALEGPHRSDFRAIFREKGRDARACSTGEQKALLIGVVLANARALALETRYRGINAAPMVLLLDEVAAHLDEDRRAALFDIIDWLGFQTFMTGADAELFAAWRGRAQAISVADGGFAEISLG